MVGTGAHSGAAGGACLTCHDQNQTTAPQDLRGRLHDDQLRRLPRRGGRHGAFHDDPTSLGTLHASVADFATTVASLGLSAACLSCHADGAGGAPANHEQLFPRAAGTAHAGIGCTALPRDRPKTDLTALACASCHAGRRAADAGGAKHATTGYAILTYQTAATAGGSRPRCTHPDRSRNCLRCHADSQVDRIASHTTGDSGFGTGRPPDRRLRHLPLERPATDKPYGGRLRQAQGTAGPPPTGCYVCHASGSGN